MSTIESVRELPPDTANRLIPKNRRYDERMKAKGFKLARVFVRQEHLDKLRAYGKAEMGTLDLFRIYNQVFSDWLKARGE